MRRIVRATCRPGRSPQPSTRSDVSPGRDMTDHTAGRGPGHAGRARRSRRSTRRPGRRWTHDVGERIGSDGVCDVSVARSPQERWRPARIRTSSNRDGCGSCSGPGRRSSSACRSCSSPTTSTRARPVLPPRRQEMRKDVDSVRPRGAASSTATTGRGRRVGRRTDRWPALVTRSRAACAAVALADAALHAYRAVRRRTPTADAAPGAQIRTSSVIAANSTVT